MAFKPGQSGNPAGRPSQYECFIDRARFLINKHTLEEILNIVENPKEFGKLRVYDAMVMRRIVEATCAEGDKSMNSLLDRILGKPKQFVEQTIDQTVTVSIDDRRKEAAEEASRMLEIAASKAKEQQAVTLVH